jgi:serine protease Do
MSHAGQASRWVFVVALVTGVGTAGTLAFQSLSAQTSSVAPSEEQAHAEALSTAFRKASRAVIPCVVTIQKMPEVQRARAEGAQRRVPDDFRGTPFEDFFGGDEDRLRKFFEEMPEPREQSGIGSGVIIDPKGVILTNHHVVAGRGKVVVRLQDGRTFDATEVKSDPRTDLAVVRIKGAGELKAARFGDSDAIEIGDWVLAIGNPFGLAETVTAGIISAKGRGIGIADREDFLQTDAAINPGNSGGPLINLSGEIVGINTAISSRSGGYQGVGFAIPINLAKWVSKQLVATGSVKRAYLGAAIQPITPELAKEFGVSTGRGALVSRIFPDSPADDAGLKPRDVIVKVGAISVGDPRELVSAVEQVRIGERTTVEIVRDGTTMKLPVTVREQPKDYGRIVRSEESESESPEKETTAAGDWGFEVGELTDEMAERLGIKDAKGVVIKSVDRGSPADGADLATGMLVTEVNRTPVSSVEAFEKALKKRKADEGLLLLVQTRQGTRFVELRSAE